MHERFFLPSGWAQTPSEDLPHFRTAKARGKPRRGCGTVSRKRARRYVADRRLPKALWPILAAVFLIAIMLDRQIEPAFVRVLSRNRQVGRKSRAAEDGQAVRPLPSETGAALNGEAALRYRPPADFQARDAAQMIAFLIRNRGKVDNDVVREKWKHIDRTSMPLAVFLRDVEAKDEWAALEHEIAMCPFPPKSATGCPNAPSSVRHRRILELMPGWLQRGEDLLTSAETDGPDLEELDRRPDDDDTTPKPTR